MKNLTNRKESLQIALDNINAQNKALQALIDFTSASGDIKHLLNLMIENNNAAAQAITKSDVMEAMEFIENVTKLQYN